VLLLVKVSLTF